MLIIKIEFIKGSETFINTLFSSDYEVFGAFFYGKKEMAKVSPGTVKNRLKSLQIEYYSSHRLSKMSIHSLNSVNEIKERENEICVVSQIYVDDEFIAYYPYVW